MRRDIGAFRHEAHVAECAGIGDRLETFAVDRIQFAIGAASMRSNRRGNESQRLKQRAAAVTNIEHPPHFGVELCFVIEIRVLPVQRMPGRSVKTTFTHAIHFY